MPHLNHGSPHRRRIAPLLALLALALASLSCITARTSLIVTHQEGQEDSLEVSVQQALTQSWIEAAQQVNDERKADFAAAGRSSDLEDLLPTTAGELGELFDVQEYLDQGYEVDTTDRGFTATRTYPLDQDRVKEDWRVRVIRDPEHPEQVIYRAKIYLDLENLQDSIFALRSEPLPDKPAITAGGSSGSSGDSGGLFGSLGALTSLGDQEAEIELWYAQKALQMSDPIEFQMIVELPGTIVLHQLNGETAGSLDGNRVELTLTEADLMAKAGKQLVFHVESILKDCSLACDAERHEVWDGDESGVSCGCTCEAGWTMVEGAGCAHCDEVCRYSDPNMVRDLENCQTNQCACQCGEGTVLNQAGTACVTVDEYDAWVADLERTPAGGPSAAELGLLFEALLDPEDDRDIDQMPGWFLLTSGERERLLDFLEALGLGVDRSQLTVDLGPDLTTDERYQRYLEQQNYLKQVRERAIQELEQEIADRRNKQRVIIQEIQGNSKLAGTLLKLPEYYQMLFKTPKQLATEYVEGRLTDEVKDRITKQAYGESPPTIEAAAAELIKQIPLLATQDSVDHYYLYLEYFQQECQGCTGNDAELAHEKALEMLRENIRPGAKNWANPGEAYDRAFRKLNSDL